MASVNNETIFPNLLIETNAGGVVAGVDEAGRGCWAGPVVAAAVILNPKSVPVGINDSKKIPPIKREILYEEILQNSHSGVGISSVEEIDALNILEATKLAMQRAVKMVNMDMDLVLIDGNKAPTLPYPTQTIIGGDAKSLSIAAASIIAKVTRDRLMYDLAKKYPMYGWEKNAGYGTKKHRQGLAEYGVTPHHRRSYKPIRMVLDNVAEVSL